MNAPMFYVWLLLARLIDPSGYLFQARIPGPGGEALGASFPALTLGVHSTCSTAAGTTCAVALGTVAAHSTIWCWAQTASPLNITSVADNVNSGNYAQFNKPMRESGHNYIIWSWYKPNVTAGSTTVTMTYGAGQGEMACLEVKGTPASTHVMDGSFNALQAATGANANSGTSLTPKNNGEMVVASGISDSATAWTAGTNFTLLDSSNPFWHQYWIQTTATATTSPFTNTSVAYALQTAALVQDNGTYGSCDADMVWVPTGTSGNTPAVADLVSGTSGWAPQLDSQIVFTGTDPNWVLGTSAAHLTYTNSATVGFKTALTCPVYSGNGTGSVVLTHDTTSTTGNGNVQWWFANTNSTVTAISAVRSPDWTSASSGTIDTFELGDDSGQFSADYALVQMNASGASTSFELECKNGAVANQFSWAAGTWYVFQLHYVQGGQHSVDIWSWDGTTLTTVGSITCTATTAGSGPAVFTGHFVGTSQSYPTGIHFQGGPIKVNLFGGSMTW